MKQKHVRIVAIALSVMMLASGFTFEPEVNAAVKPSIEKKATVKTRKSVVLTIKTNGFAIKKVTAKSSDKSVATVKATKKALTIKGIKPGSAIIKSTVTVKNGKKTKKFSYSTRVTVTGKEKREVSLADFVGEYRRVDISDLLNPKPNLNDPTKSTLVTSDDGYSFSSSLSMESGEAVNIGPIQLKDSDMTYEKMFNEAENQYEYVLKYALSNGGNITFTKMGTGYWLAMEYITSKYTYSEAHLRV